MQKSNPIKNKAYIDELQNNDLLPLIQLSENGYSVNYNPPMQNNPTISNKLGLGLTNFRQGFNENLKTPFSGQNLNASDNPSLARKVGEGLGSTARWLDNPLVRGLMMGGITYLNGGSGVDALTNGLTSTMLNQQVKTADRLYRQKLLDMGYSEDEINTLPGYVDKDSFKNISDSDYRTNMINLGQYRAENDNNYHINKLDLDSQKLDADIDYHNNLIEQKKAQNFITNDEYYEQLLNQQVITPEEYHKIISSSGYDGKGVINLNALNAVTKQADSKTKRELAEDTMTTNKQKRKYAYINNGKNVIRVEYAPKPDSKSDVHVYYHDKPGYNPNPAPSPKPKPKSEYSDTYDKHHPKKTKGGKIF